METVVVLSSARILMDSGYSKVRSAGAQATVTLCASLRSLHEFRCLGNGSTGIFHEKHAYSTVFLAGIKVIHER